MPDPISPPDVYPQPGICCEHNFNSHARKHCLLCDCEKRPTVILPPPPKPEIDDPSSPVLEVIECGVCHGLTTPQAREAHLGWHERLTNTPGSVYNAVARLTGNPTVETDEKETLL